MARFDYKIAWKSATSIVYRFCWAAEAVNPARFANTYSLSYLQ